MEPRNISEESFGALQGCLVEGDPEQRARQRRVRRRALALSVLLQAAVLIAVVLVPLFAKTERIALANVTPVPPYQPYRHAARVADAHTPPNPCRICPGRIIPNTIVMHTTTSEEGANDPQFPELTEGPADPNAIPIPDARPPKPEVERIEQKRPQTVHITTIDPAMLKRRVDPVYPTLMKQTRREGRVEIHAIIGADGSMQSIQAVGGDPMFYSSALAAVQQWIYKPTYLNGQPVQVDTTITVIYSMQH
jgi:protein TonB